MKKINRASALLAASVLLEGAHAKHNGLAATPPMGWNSWNHFHCTISELII